MEFVFFLLFVHTIHIIFIHRFHFYHLQVKLATDTLSKRMVEPRRQCLALPASDLQKKAVGGVLYITVLSARKICRSSWKCSPSRRQKCSEIDSFEEDQLEKKELHTLVEIELEELTRRTNVRTGSNPKWDSTFNMILHDNAGILRFHLYEWTPASVKYDYLTSCEIKVQSLVASCLQFEVMQCDLEC